MATASAAANIALALRSGRLAVIPLYDDVVYLNDAYSRVIFEKSATIWDWAVSFISNPPHSPLSTLTGMIGYTLVGPYVIGPYLANIWILGFYVAAIYLVSRRSVGTTESLLISAIFLFVPVAHAMINEFRPDMAALPADGFQSLRDHHSKARRHELAQTGSTGSPSRGSSGRKAKRCGHHRSAHWACCGYEHGASLVLWTFPKPRDTVSLYASYSVPHGCGALWHHLGAPYRLLCHAGAVHQCGCMGELQAARLFIGPTTRSGKAGASASGPFFRQD